jgi:hypothetical protein
MKSSISAGSTLLKSKLLPALICISGLYGQQGDQVSAKVDLVAWGQQIDGLSLGTSGGATHKALSFTLTKSISYNGPALMEIHQAGASLPDVAAGQKLANIPPALLERRKKSPTLVALAPIPQGARRVAVLLAPASGGFYQAYVINCDPTNMPVGKLAVLNLSAYKIQLQFSTNPKPQVLGTNAMLVAEPKDEFISYQLDYLEGEMWTTQENNILPVSKEDQTLMVVLKSSSELFRNSFGGARGFLQIVTLRRSPREATEVVEITRAEQEAARKQAEIDNKAMDEAAKPKAERKPTPK